MMYLLPMIVAAAAAASAAAPATRPASAANGGWTLLFPGTHRIYVSSSAGNDANDGSPLRPLRTLRAAAARVRDGDDLLLKRGDTFVEESIGAHKWHHVTVGAWGNGPRPIVAPNTSAEPAVLILNGGDVRFVGLHLTAAHRDPARSDFRLAKGNYGIYTANCDNVLIEDCLIEFFNDDISVQGKSARGFRLRRSVIRHAYSIDHSFAQGIFLDGMVAPLIEDCVFDTCGWNPYLQAEYERRTHDPSAEAGRIPRWVREVAADASQPFFPGTANMFNHGVYDHDGSGATASTVRNCIFVNCAASGMTQGVGGTVEDCLFIHNGMAADVWTGDGAGRIARCVCLGSLECPSWAGGGGITLMSHSGTLEDNVIAHGAPPEHGAALMVWAHKGREAEIPPDARAVVRDNVVYDWPAGDAFYIATIRSRIEFTGNRIARSAGRPVNAADARPADYAFARNEFERGTRPFWFQSRDMDFDAFRQAAGAQDGHLREPGQVRFPDPSRTIESYAQSVGLPATLHDFMRAADRQSRENWDPRFTASAVNDYIRQGFGLPRSQSQ